MCTRGVQIIGRLIIKRKKINWIAYDAQIMSLIKKCTNWMEQIGHWSPIKLGRGRSGILHKLSEIMERR